MVLNTGRCHFIYIGKNFSDSELLKLNDLNLENCREVEILWVTSGRNVNFKSYSKNTYRKANQKLNALLRISSHIVTDKKALFYKSLIRPQFAVCPVVWMFALDIQTTL